MFGISLKPKKTLDVYEKKNILDNNEVLKIINDIYPVIKDEIKVFDESICFSKNNTAKDLLQHILQCLMLLLGDNDFSIRDIDEKYHVIIKEMLPVEVFHYNINVDKFFRLKHKKKTHDEYILSLRTIAALSAFVGICAFDENIHYEQALYPFTLSEEEFGREFDDVSDRFLDLKTIVQGWIAEYNLDYAFYSEMAYYALRNKEIKDYIYQLKKDVNLIKNLKYKSFYLDAIELMDHSLNEYFFSTISSLKKDDTGEERPINMMYNFYHGNESLIEETIDSIDNEFQEVGLDGRLFLVQRYEDEDTAPEAYQFILKLNKFFKTHGQ